MGMRLVVYALLSVVVMPLPVMGESSISGAARVIDGDTLEVGGRLIHLHGIDAPETGQVCALYGQPSPCGREATNLLRRLTDGQVVACREVDRDRNGRIIAKCKAGWMDLGAEMVTMGMAVAYLRNSDDYLRNSEQWRKGERHPVETTGDNLPVQ
jgi:endonuclease YncB( thermonuclease family)